MAKPKLNRKPKGSGLPVRTFEGKYGDTYIVFGTLPGGPVHVFVEVEAKQAAIECGATNDTTKTPHQLWNEAWKKDKKASR